MLSYSKGPDGPLIQATIAEVFRETAERLPNNVALISRHQNVRLTFSELSAEVERTARGAGPDRCVVHQLRGVGCIESGLRENWRGASECQPGVSRI
jgi:non-ribosomal peptide synthetase component F